METDKEHSIVLFDGVCNLCAWSVRFIIERDPAGRFQFAPLQSDLACRMLAGKLQPRELSSVVLIEGGRVYSESAAALRIARRLRGAWKLLYALVVIPRPLRDLLYRLVARYRYRWFGQSESCILPTPALRQRFLETEAVADAAGHRISVR